MPIIALTLLAGTIYTLIFLISIANIINPKWIWEKFESHTATKEPTKAYFVMRRVVGVIGLMVVSCLVLLPLVHYLN